MTTAIESATGRPPARETYALVNYDGELCVAYSAPLQDRPVMLTNYWPVGVRVVSFERNYGSWQDGELTPDYLGAGEFLLRPRERWQPALTIRLKDGGKTQPVYTLELNYDCPRVRKGTETEYRNGRWYKLLKRGWVEA